MSNCLDKLTNAVRRWTQRNLWRMISQNCRYNSVLLCLVEFIDAMDRLMLEAAEEIVSKSPAKLLGGSSTGYGRNVVYQKDEDDYDSFFDFRTQLLQALMNQKFKSNKETRSFKHSEPDNSSGNAHLKEKLELSRICNDQVLKNQEVNTDLLTFSNINENHSNEVKISDASNGMVIPNQNLKMVDDSNQNMQGLSKIEKRKLVKSEFLANVSVLDVKMLDNKSSNTSSGSCAKCKCDPKPPDEVNIMEQISSQPTVEVKTQRKNHQRHKNTRKSNSVYLCPKCGISYVLSHESVLPVTKCLNCDYWTPEDPEFKKSQKTVTSDCKVS